MITEVGSTVVHEIGGAQLEETSSEGGDEIEDYNHVINVITCFFLYHHS